MSAALSSQRTTRPFLMVYHDFLEEALALLSGDAFKVAIFIYRETVGRGESYAALSYTQLQKGTGIKHRPALSRALKVALASGMVRCCELVGFRGTKTYALGDATTSTPVVPVRDVTSTPVVPELVHQSYQNQYTSRTSSSTPVVPVTPRQPAPQEAPRVPKETYRNVEINDKENVGVALVPAECNQVIENREETMGKVNPVLELMWEGVREEFKGRETPAAFENWIMPLTVIGCEGMVLYLQAKTSYNAQAFQQRFAAQASSILSRHIHQDAEIRCLPPASAGRSA